MTVKQRNTSFNELLTVFKLTDLNLSPNLPLIYSSEQLIKSIAFQCDVYTLLNDR